MRWIVILLLMLNGIYFLWQNYLMVPVEQAVVLPLNGEQGQPIALLSEVETQPLPKKPAASNDKPEQAVCWMLGPLPEIVSAKQVVDRMAALEIELAVKELVVPGKPTYWVHIPPLASKKLALKKLRELQRAKIDSFLVTEGDNKHAISLGFFTTRERAERVQQERQSQGYSVEIHDVPRTRTEIWLVSEQSEYEKISEPLWEKIKEGNTELERRKNYCKTIASIEKLD